MKILIDINHPAHVHYFRNFIKIMEKKGHQFRVINRDSDIINQLLDYYEIKHIIRYKRPTKKSSFHSLLYLCKCILTCVKESISFRPDMYVGFASTICAITSFIFRRPSILIDDTEHNHLNHKLYGPFCSVTLTPFYFNKSLGDKQIYFRAFVEQLYLHSNYYTQNNEVLQQLNVLSDKYVLARFTAFDAHHDLNIKLNSESRANILKTIEGYEILLSMESESLNTIPRGRILHISPEKIHDVEAHAKFLIGDGGTMSTEAFVLGVPTICINPLNSGSISYQETNYSYRVVHCSEETVIQNTINSFSELRIDTQQERAKLEEETIDPTAFLVWFVENYPESSQIMKENPDYQYNFK